MAVVGGGPAGAVAAQQLARRGRAVRLVEASRYGGWRLGETLFPSIQEPLAALGLAGPFEQVPALPSGGVRSRWGREETGSRSFLTSPYDAGRHLDRAAFDRTLAQAARKAGATVQLGTRVVGCEFDPDGRLATLTLQRADGSGNGSSVSSLHAEAVIDATGRTARVARWLAGRRALVDRLVAAAARLRVDAGTCGRYALVEAVPDGWWYSAPLPEKRLVVMFFTDADLLEERRRAGPWREALKATEETAVRAGDAPLERGPVVASAVSHRLRRDVGEPRWLAVGDAALGIDPLSGRGIERAVDTGVRGALVLDRWLDGDRAAAERYRRKLSEEFEAYLDRRRAYYALEDRWPDRPFWRRRHGSEEEEAV